MKAPKCEDHENVMKLKTSVGTKLYFDCPVINCRNIAEKRTE